MSKVSEFLNSNVLNVVRRARNPVTGDLFGVELECEGKKVDWQGNHDTLLENWVPHNDGSLRNHHGTSCEWVFNGPVDYANSVGRVHQLFDYFAKNKASLVTSNRTSTHVHFNMSDKKAYQVINLYILYTVFEDILERFCGDDRRGNVFCLSSRHAQDQVRWITDACFKNHNFGNFQDEWRYCSLNLAALNKFATVEFRAMRGLDNAQDVISWLTILNELCDYACYQMRSPIKLIEDISMKTPKGFFGEVFSPAVQELLLKGVTDAELYASIYEGLRVVQVLAYRIGAEFSDVRFQGRDFWAAQKKNKTLDDFPKDVAPENVMAPPPHVRVGLRPGIRLEDAIRHQEAQNALRRAAHEAEVAAGMRRPADPLAVRMQRPVVHEPIDNPFMNPDQF